MNDLLYQTSDELLLSENSESGPLRWDSMGDQGGQDGQDALGRDLDAAKKRAHLYSNRLLIAERGGSGLGVKGKMLIPPPVPQQESQEDEYSVASENSGTTNNTNCAVTNTFPYMLATNRDDESNLRVLKLQREITSLRTENMVTIARNLALEQKLATYAGMENTEIKSEGGTAQDVSEQVDEKFVKTCKVQLVEANLVAQDLCGERDELKKKLESCEEECDALARLVQALSRKIIALDSPSANDEEQTGEEERRGGKDEDASLDISDTSIAALASDTGLAIIKHLVKGDRDSLHLVRGSPQGSPRDRRQRGVGRSLLMTTSPGLSMGLRGAVGSVLDEPRAPPPLGPSPSSPTQRQARKPSDDSGTAGSTVAAGKSRPRSAVSPESPRVKRASKTKPAARSAPGSGAGAGAGASSSSSSGRAGSKARLKAAVPSFRDSSGVRRSIKVVVPSGKQTTNAGAAQPTRRRAAAKGGDGAGNRPTGGAGGGGGSAGSGSSRAVAIPKGIDKGSIASQAKRAAVRPAPVPAAPPLVVGAAAVGVDMDVDAETESDAGSGAAALDESALGNLSLDSDAPEFSVFANALEAVARRDSERAPGGDLEVAEAAAAAAKADKGRSRTSVKPPLPRPRERERGLGSKRSHKQ